MYVKYYKRRCFFFKNCTSSKLACWLDTASKLGLFYRSTEGRGTDRRKDRQTDGQTTANAIEFLYAKYSYQNFVILCFYLHFKVCFYFLMLSSF